MIKSFRNNSALSTPLNNWVVSVQRYDVYILELGCQRKSIVARIVHNTLTQHGGIWLLELKKFKENPIETEDQRWLKFFREGEQLNDEALPDWMITREMKQAMSTLSTFSEKDQHYYQYQARQEYLREQRTIQHELEQANQREEAAKRREELALQEKQAAQKREEAAQKREEAAKKREELALQEKQAAQQREELAIAEIERLKALLAQKDQ